VERDPKEVIDDAFQEALRRDPKREMKWVVVVDGGPEQLRIIRRCVKRYNVKVTLVLDFIHVAGYVWKAAFAFHRVRLLQSARFMKPSGAWPEEQAGVGAWSSQSARDGFA
jgi:hypothetical protein